MKLNLMSQEIDGRKYGVGRCDVQLGPGKLDAVAVVCDGERWVSTEKDCVAWLTKRGMSEEQAARFVRLGLQAWDESHSVGIA